MQVSPDEALDLLRKWYSERTLLKALQTVPQLDIAVQVSGFINGLGNDILISDATSPDDPTHNHIIFPVRIAHSYEYVEAKDFRWLPPEIREELAAKHGSANLRIVLEKGLTSFFESPMASAL